MEAAHLTALLTFIAGVIIGVVATMAFNKVRGGNMSAQSAKREMEDYQEQVEAHFDSTSRKFKQLAGQYQDLYDHLSKGAVELCRPENLTPALGVKKDDAEEEEEAGS